MTRRWAPTVLLAAAVLLCLGLVVWAALSAQAGDARAEREAKAFSPAPAVTPSPLQLPIVAVIGDGSTSQAAPGVGASDRWTSLLARANNVDVQSFASAGAGYTASGADDRTFLQQAARVPVDAQVVFVFGGASDSDASSVQITRAVSRTISTLQSRAPGATIIITGPATTDGASVDALTSLRADVQAAANSFGIRFVDPNQQAWLTRTVAQGSDLRESDQNEFARRFEVLTTQVTRTTS